ncbi:ferredoxin [Rhodococcus sp. NPDC003348]
MRVVADFERCEANAICVGLAPDIFDLNDDEELSVAPGPVPAHLERAVRDSVNQCPRAALREIE